MGLAGPVTCQAVAQISLTVDFRMGDPERPKDDNVRDYGRRFRMPREQFEATVASALVEQLHRNPQERVLPWQFVVGGHKHPRLVVLLTAEKADWKVRLDFQAEPTSVADITNPSDVNAVVDVFFPEAEIAPPKQADFHSQVVELFTKRFLVPDAGRQLQRRLRKLPVGPGVVLVDATVEDPRQAYGALMLPYNQYAHLAMATFEESGRLRDDEDKTTYKIGSTGARRSYQVPGWPVAGIKVRHDSLEGNPIGKEQLRLLKGMEGPVYYRLVKPPDETDEPFGEPSAAALTLPTVRSVQ
jgi:hypothetical protein